MPVSGVGPSSHYPQVPPTSGTPAYSFVALGQLTDIAGALGAAAAGGVSPTGSVNNSQQDTENAELQAMADLAKIHIYLSQTPPDMKDALAAANDFLALNQQYKFTDSGIQNVYSQVKQYLSPPNGPVDGFKPDAKGNTFSYWWMHGADGTDTNSGIGIVFSAISSILSSDKNFGPNPQHPAALVNMCILYADALTTPYGMSLQNNQPPNNQVDVAIWGAQAYPTPFCLASALPYAIATYAEIVSGGDPSTYTSTVQGLVGLFKDVQNCYFSGDQKNTTPVTHTNYDQAIDMLNDLEGQANPQTGQLPWPPNFIPDTLSFNNDPTDTYNDFIGQYNVGSSGGGGNAGGIAQVYQIIFGNIYNDLLGF